MTSPNSLSPPVPTRPGFFRSLSSSSSASGLRIVPRKDKPRLYLALYPRGGPSSAPSYSSSMTCDSYHWTLVVGPKNSGRGEAGTCYQIVHTGASIATGTACPSSFYEETDLSQQSQAQSRTLLARVTLAKVIDEARVQSLIRALPPSTPPSSDQSNNSDSDYDTDDAHATSTCLTWVKTAYKALTCDSAKCLRSYVGPADWPEIEEGARKYLRKKRAQGRFSNNNGQALAEAQRNWNENEIPTWNFWENRETTA